MKKIFFILIPIVSILLLIFFITKVDHNYPIEITYDGKPYKIKAENPQAPQKNLNQSIYDEIYSEKKPIIIENIVSGSENPVSLDQDLNNIDKIINHIINENDLKEYKGIKIFITKPTQGTFKPIKIAKKDPDYIIDLGLYYTRKQALEKQTALEKLYPKSKDFLYTINTKSFSPELVLFNLQLKKVSDFNTAKNMCEKLNKYKESCVITNLH